MNHLILQVTAVSDTGQATGSVLGVISEMGIIGWVVLASIFILSVIAVFVFFERYQTIRRATKEDAGFMDRVRGYVMAGKINEALELCRNDDRPSAKMVEKGLKRIGKPVNDIKDSIENVANLEIYKLEKNMNILATIAGAAPMLGFLGTVTGMIKTFMVLEGQETNVDPAALAGGIYESMMTTAFGLAVGIVAYVAFNLLVSMVEKTIHTMEASAVDFIDLLQEPSN